MKNDIKKVMFSEKEIAQKISELGVILKKEYKDLNPIVISVLKGSFIFAADLIRTLDFPLQIDFIIASSYGSSSESSGQVNIIKDLEYDITNRHILILEDIIDSGITMDLLMKKLNNRNPASIKLCALLSKPSRRKVELNIDFCGWEVPDEFIVGYGLDYAEKYRNLPDICILNKEIYS